MIVRKRLRALHQTFPGRNREADGTAPLLHLSTWRTGIPFPPWRPWKNSRALSRVRYQLLYDGDTPPQLPSLKRRRANGESEWGSTGKDARTLTGHSAVCSGKPPTTTSNSCCRWRTAWRARRGIEGPRRGRFALAPRRREMGPVAEAEPLPVPFFSRSKARLVDGEIWKRSGQR